MKPLDEVMKSLPPEEKREVFNFIEFLQYKHRRFTAATIKDKKVISFSWEGRLSTLKGKYTSVELQHKALEWR